MSTAPPLTWESSHEFYFKTSADVTPLSLADNLIGLDGVLRRSGDVIGKLLGARVSDVEILLESVELNSYKDNFLFRLTFGKGRAAEKKLDELRKKIGVDEMSPKTMIAAVVLVAVAWAAMRFAGPKPEPAVTMHIENSFNAGSEKLGVTRDELVAILDATLGKRAEDVKKHVVKMAHPDGQEEGGEIVFDGEESLKVPKEIITVIPASYEKAEPKSRDVDYIKRDITIRALDLDRPGAGWWAIAPDVAERRLPLSIGAEVDPNKVPIGKTQSADFTVTWKREKSGEETPSRILLHRIHRN